MALLELVVYTLVRRPGRSLLTMAGVATGLGAVVVLVSLALGFERSWGAVYEAGRADLLVGRTTSRRPLPTPIPEAVVHGLRDVPGVEAAAAVMADMLGLDDAPAVLLFGWEPGAFLWEHLDLLDGRWPRAGERTIALGAILTK
mgnify:CR=1 FL=1